MRILIKLQLLRMIKQKALWAYLAAMLAMMISSCVSLQDPANDFHLIYSGGLFPVSELQNQAAMIGPLFFALIAAFSVNGERTTGIIRQPLLCGITKTGMLNGKILTVVIIMAASVLLMEALSFLIGFIVWGNAVFSDITYCLLRIGLTLVPLSVSCIGFILLTLYTSNMPVTMCVVLLILLADNLVNQFFISTVSGFSYMYYNYANSGFNAAPLEAWMIPQGLILSGITGVAFYLLALRRIHKMII